MQDYKRAPRGPFVVIVLLLLLIWIVTMVFRWELRAQWWAYQVAQAASREDRDFYIIRLASIRDKSLNAVPRLLEDHRPEVREAGIAVLRYCESDRAAGHLIEMLADPNPDVSGMAATTLAWRPNAGRFTPRLESRLSDSPSPAAWGVAVALGRIGGDRAERALQQALAKPIDADVKAQIIDSLGLLGCEKAVPLMIDALADDRPLQTTPFSQFSAQRAVGALRSELLSHGADPNAALEAVSTQPTVAAVAARWIKLLSGIPAENVASQPAAQRADSIVRLKKGWSTRPAGSRPE